METTFMFMDVDIFTVGGVFCNMYCTAANVHYSYRSYQVWSRHAVTEEIKMCISLRALVCMFPALARTAGCWCSSDTQMKIKH